MCKPSGKMPGPTKQELDAQEASRRANEAALKREQLTATQLKEEQTEITNANLAGRRGRRSLLTGKRKGGGGFELAEGYQTKGTLGA